MRRPTLAHIMARTPGRGFLVMCAVLAVALLATPPPASAWLATIQYPYGYGSGGTVATGPLGELAVGGDLSTVARLDPDTGEPLWQVSDGYAIDRVWDIGWAGSGDIIAAGQLYQFTVRRFAAEDGSELWRRQLGGTLDQGSAREIAIMGGSIFAAGDVEQGGKQAFTVVAMDEVDGSIDWTFSTAGTETVGSLRNQATEIAIDTAGDVIAGGTLENAGGDQDLVVVKLDGSSGSELWRHTENPPVAGFDTIADVAVDADGDVVVATGVGLAASATVRKLARNTGAILWEYQAVDVERLLVLPGGDVLAAGRIDDGPAVVRLAGGTGAEIWRALWDATATSGAVYDMAMDPTGLLYAAASIRYPGTDYRMGLAGLDVSDGSIHWRAHVSGTRNEGMGGAAAGEVAVDVTGTPIVVGTLTVSSGSNNNPAQKSVVWRQTRALAGRKMVVRDRADAADRAKLKVVLKDVNVLAAARGTPDDPTVGGAQLDLFNPTSLERATIPLPAANWSVRIPGLVGRGSYKYVDPSGICQKVIVKNGKKIIAKCRGSGIGFTLDEASQGSLIATLILGGAPAHYQCGEFGGLVLKDEPERFVAKSAPAPVSCPEPTL